MSFLSSWKTSAAGISTLLISGGGILNLIASGASIATIVASPSLAGFLGGIGLLYAKDWNVTSAPK